LAQSREHLNDADQEATATLALGRRSSATSAKDVENRCALHGAPPRNSIEMRLVSATSTPGSLSNVEDDGSARAIELGAQVAQRSWQANGRNERLEL
jgi:hypothetical protein